MKFCGSHYATLNFMETLKIKFFSKKIFTKYSMAFAIDIMDECCLSDKVCY